MHMPDGYINLATSVAGGVAAAGAVGASLKQTGKELSDRQIPLAGLVAAFVFAVQMLNFPVAAGTSGHLMGGAMAAILLGPWMGILVVSVVVIVQALLFADGGIVVMGLNVLNMAVLTAFVGWVVFRVLMKVLPKTTGAAVGASMIAAWVSVLAASFGFVIQYALGGEGGAPLGTVFGAMTGVHSLIGIGEGIISAVAVGAVLAARPDLVRGTTDLGLEKSSVTPSGRAITGLAVAGLAVAILLVFFVAPIASGDPNGLEKVAMDAGFADAGQDHPIGGPLADYGVSGVESERVGTMIAGTVGVALTFVVGFGLISLLRRRRTV